MKLQGWIQQFQPMKHYVIATAFVFLIGVFLGYTDSSAFEKLIHVQLEQMQGIADEIKQADHQQWELFLRIILNNLLASGVVILFGLFFGLVPLYFLVSNGMLLGYIAANRSEGETMFHILVGLLPHGIFEIPAIILASAVGLRLGFIMLESFGSLFNLERRKRYQMKLLAFIKLLIPMLALITGLMLLAAIIESTVTYTLMKYI
jgi:stage II sporulation protein M